MLPSAAAYALRALGARQSEPLRRQCRWSQRHALASEPQMPQAHRRRANQCGKRSRTRQAYIWPGANKDSGRLSTLYPSREIPMSSQIDRLKTLALLIKGGETADILKELGKRLYANDASIILRRDLSKPHVTPAISSNVRIRPLEQRDITWAKNRNDGTVVDPWSMMDRVYQVFVSSNTAITRVSRPSVCSGRQW